MCKAQSWSGASGVVKWQVSGVEEVPVMLFVYFEGLGGETNDFERLNCVGVARHRCHCYQRLLTKTCGGTHWRKYRGIEASILLTVVRT